MSLLNSMDAITQKVEHLTNPVVDDAPPFLHEHERAEADQRARQEARRKEKESGNKDVNMLNVKVEELEKGGRRLKKALDGLKSDFEGLSGRLKKSAVRKVSL